MNYDYDYAAAAAAAKAKITRNELFSRTSEDAGRKPQTSKNPIRKRKIHDSDTETSTSTSKAKEKKSRGSIARTSMTTDVAIRSEQHERSPLRRPRPQEDSQATYRQRRGHDFCR